jgi:hypothetical protein
MVLLPDKFCKTCNKRKPKAQFQRFWDKYWGKGRFRFHAMCKECRCAQTNEWKRTHDGSKLISAQRESRRNDILFHSQRRLWAYKKRAKTFGIPFQLKASDLVSLYVAQKGLCYYTGEQMLVGNKLGKSRRNSLSLDRLDQTKGYVRENVVWCINLVNIMKQTMSEQQFYDFMRNILDRRNQRERENVRIA